MNRRQARKLHKQLWGWLALTGDGKDNWPEWEYNGGTIKETQYTCFCCETLRGKGSQCPVRWGILGTLVCKHTGCSPCMYNTDSPYNEWENCGRYSAKKQKYAAIIRDLPWYGKNGKLMREDANGK
jgi:hypothetical protein